ncbi:E3 ubiquitin-protein ligase WAV3-like [Impatiens glandulifera]|uniref:E3 ubiquitin-protein ligase WAV3-like n=1 Tax=Impatiens glandulifera TaxID=253017 RepID=UPI001FB04B29|nr:E3 ubiquitin-protein ligase WAV3-like [Impatiens glandulifera]
MVGGRRREEEGFLCKLKRAMKLILQTTTTCTCSFPPEKTTTLVAAAAGDPLPHFHHCSSGETVVSGEPNSSNTKNLCPICLDVLSYGGTTTDSSPGQAIFTAQCSHSFHFTCISSNVRHGSLNCPVCRAHWSHLPRNLQCSDTCINQTDPILRILDDSIATFRVQRRSFLRSARYDDDDPIQPDRHPDHPHLRFSVHQICRPSNNYLSVTLNHLPATDLVLVASPNGPHLRLIKQCMALVVCSLRPIDRVAIVTYSSAAARVFPLRCMTPYGKRTALQVIDRLFYFGQSDPMEGLQKGIKIIEDRTYKNPQCSILHLSNSPTRTYQCTNDDENPIPIPIHRFHVGYGHGTSNGFVMNEFKEFLARVVGGAITEVRLRIGESGRIVDIGELRSGEERRIPLDFEESRNLRLVYSYKSPVAEECYRTGEAEVDDGGSQPLERSLLGRTNGFESWGYDDPYRTRRWAKHLHGYRI